MAKDEKITFLVDRKKNSNINDLKKVHLHIVSDEFKSRIT